MTLFRYGAASFAITLVITLAVFSIDWRNPSNVIWMVAIPVTAAAIAFVRGENTQAVFLVAVTCSAGAFFIGAQFSGN